jgi:tetratricopeptide (TPR) repeat protein
MIKNLLRKLFLKKQKVEEENKTSSAQIFKEKAEILSSTLTNSIKKAREEFSLMRKKCENLLETNYNLGIFHLEKGNLRDAIFRFKFIKKFWPNHTPSIYQLAYCLMIDKKTHQAKEILEELIKKDPNYQDAVVLLNHIKSVLKNQNSL